MWERIEKGKYGKYFKYGGVGIRNYVNFIVLGCLGVIGGSFMGVLVISSINVVRVWIGIFLGWFELY